MTLRIEKGSCKYTFLISLAAFEISFRFCNIFSCFKYICLVLTLRVYCNLGYFFSAVIVNIRYIRIFFFLLGVDNYCPLMVSINTVENMDPV